MKTAVMIMTISALLLSGCAMTGMSSAFDKNGLPKQQYYVGGGFGFDYKATETGIFYIVEKNTGKFVITKSLDAGETFEESINPSDENLMKSLASLGIDTTNMAFSFYFVPNGSQPAAQEISEK